MLNMNMESRENRGRLQIIAEILTVLRVPAGKANITCHCNMSTAQSGRYLNLMRTSDLVQTNTCAGKLTYRRTEAGLQFLEFYKRMTLLLDSSISSAFLV
jgi:predicted transcriptional regulator